MKFAIGVLALVLCSQAHAVTRTFTATAEQAQVSLESVAGAKDLYYIQVDNVESDEAGRPFIVRKVVSGGGRDQEDFSYPKLDFFVRLGGSAAKSYTKPPTVGFLTFNNKDFKLSTDQRSVKLADAYSEAECLGAADRASAEKAHQEALEKVKATCGFSPKLVIDWASFEKSNKAGLACNAREALMGLADVCKDDDYKKAAAAIKMVEVAYGSGDAFKKSSGSMKYVMPALPENTRFRARLFLQDSL